MNINAINLKEFCSLLAELKEEISKNSADFADEGDNLQVFLNSNNLLIKELKGVSSLEDLSLEQKKVLFPHISYVYTFIDYLTEEEDPFDDFFEEDFDDEDLDDEDLDDDHEESEIEDVKPKTQKPIAMTKKESSCCNGGSCKSSDKPKKK